VERSSTTTKTGPGFGFWRRIGETVERFGWEMFAATLMTNHFHLFFRTPEANLSRGMQSLLSGYAQWWNRRHRQSGHVFQGRFRGHVIENETYFWTVSRYVHLNPVPVPVLVASPRDWPWSTYAGSVDPTRRWDWVAYETRLSVSAWQGTFGGRNSSAAYEAFVEGGEASVGDPFATAIDGWILGSQPFADRIREQLQPANRRTPTAVQRTSLGQLEAAVRAHFGIGDHELASAGSRHPARAALAYLARQHPDCTLRELAARLGLARADCVPYLIRRARSARPGSTLHSALEHVEQSLQLTSTTAARAYDRTNP
jgi:REP element-mobilizing transposase RayT